MKKKILNFIFLISIFLLCSFNVLAERVIDNRKLQKDEEKNLVYIQGEKNNFTGMAKIYYMNGKLLAKVPYVNGKINGIVEVYYRNGNLKTEFLYRDSVLIEEKYYKNNLSAKKIIFPEDKNFNELSLAYLDVAKNFILGDMGKSIFFSTILGFSIIIGIIIFIILNSIVKIYSSFLKTKNLTDEQRNKILNILIKHSDESKELPPSIKLYNFRLVPYKIHSMIADSEKVYIYAKVLTLFFIPLPVIFGYFVCLNKDRILSTLSNTEFKNAKKEIKETLLYL